MLGHYPITKHMLSVIYHPSLGVRHHCRCLLTVVIVQHLPLSLRQCDPFANAGNDSIIESCGGSHTGHVGDPDLPQKGQLSVEKTDCTHLGT